MTEPVTASARRARLRHLAPVLVGLGLFALGIWALHHLLQPIHAADIIA